MENDYRASKAAPVIVVVSQLSLMLFSGFNRFFKRVSVIDLGLPSVNGDFGKPFTTSFIPVHSHNSGFCFGRHSPVSHVFSLRSFPKISPFIVKSISIDMVNYIFRPSFCHQKGGNPVGSVVSALVRYYLIPHSVIIVFLVSGYLPRIHLAERLITSFARTLFYEKIFSEYISSVRVVIEYSKSFFVCQFLHFSITPLIHLLSATIMSGPRSSVTTKII